MALGFTTQLFSLPFYVRNIVNHLFCDVFPVLRLVCADTALSALLIFIAIVIIVMIPFSLTDISYLLIIHAVLQIPSAVGQRQSFSMCAAHLVVVTLSHSTAGIHLQPKGSLMQHEGNGFSVIHSYHPNAQPHHPQLEEPEIQAKTEEMH